MISRSVWIAFAALCLASGTYWILPTSELLPALERQGLLFGVAALAALCFRPRRRIRPAAHLRLAIAGIGFFGLPTVALEIARSGVGETTRSALFAMVPVVIIVAIITSDAAAGARRLLIPALVGLGGLLLLLPLQSSFSLRGEWMLSLISATIVVTGICSVWLYRLLQGLALPIAILTVGAANAIFLLLCAAACGDFVWSAGAFNAVASFSSVVDVLEIVVIIWLLREMPPIRFAARYLLIPLVTIVESFVLVRPAITLRIVSGTVLLAAGAGMLLILSDSDTGDFLSLR